MRTPDRAADPPGDDRKATVEAFWDAMSCGEIYADGENMCGRLRAQARTRYLLEPYIHDFACFADGAGRDVLEIGVGMGADHVEWARVKPRSLAGIDLTARAVEHTRVRLECEGLPSDVRVGDAEALPYADASFDIVYSWGVLHHSPDTPQAFREVHRVLRPGGVARIMVYHKWSVVGYMLWLRYAAATGKLTRTLADIYANCLESPGTKAYTIREARTLMQAFREVGLRTQLSFGDLLQGAVGQRHSALLLTTAKALWPRWLIRRALARHGLYLLICAVK